MLGTLTTEQIDEVLMRQLIGRIGCQSNNKVFIVPVSYAYDGKHIYARSKDGLKVETMRNNPQVCFEVEDLRDMGNWQTVILWGKFREITNPTERANSLELLHKRRLPLVSTEHARLSPEWPFQPSNINDIDGVVYSIEIREKTGRFERVDVLAR